MCPRLTSVLLGFGTRIDHVRVLPPVTPGRHSDPGAFENLENVDDVIIIRLVVRGDAEPKRLRVIIRINACDEIRWTEVERAQAPFDVVYVSERYLDIPLLALHGKVQRDILHLHPEAQCGEDLFARWPQEHGENRDQSRAYQITQHADEEVRHST